MIRFSLPIALCCTATGMMMAQQTAPTTATQAAQYDSSYIDENGTAHITRVVPLPTTVSEEARHLLARRIPDFAEPIPLEQHRTDDLARQIQMGKAWSLICPNQFSDTTMAGVPVHVIVPEGIPDANRDKVLLNLHGGGFMTDTGSYTESIPVAYYSKIKTVSVLYRMGPENPYPAAVDDTVAVYKELLKTYKPVHIAIYGTSAGAILTAQVAVHLQSEGLPLPGALGIFTGLGDFADLGDSAALFAVPGLAGHLDPPSSTPRLSPYLHGANPADPMVSPIHANLKHMPPTLFVSSERDMLLSATSNLHRAFYKAGVDARLIVYDGLMHGFWNHPELPESIEANHIMADFFLQALSK